MVLGDAVSKLETFVSICWSLFTLEWPTWSFIWCCQFIDWLIYWIQFPVQFRNDNIDSSVKSEIIHHVTSALCTYSVSKLCRRYTDLFLESILAIFVLASSSCTLFSRRMFITLPMINVTARESFRQLGFLAYPSFSLQCFIRLVMVSCYINPSSSSSSSSCCLVVIVFMIARCLCWDSAHSWISQKRWGHRLSCSARPRFSRPC